MGRYSLFVIIFCYSTVITEASYAERREFHKRICKLRPLLNSCASVYTISDYKRELEQKNNETGKRVEEGKTQFSSGKKKDTKRSAWWQESDEDDYEYYLWRKYRRDKYRRRHGISPSSSSEIENHYHYHYNPYRSYYQPSSYYPHAYTYPHYHYPSYGWGGYPSYGGGYGGYGGGFGQLFSIGGGRQLGISTPIGGFGFGSGFGIGIG